MNYTDYSVEIADLSSFELILEAFHDKALYWKVYGSIKSNITCGKIKFFKAIPLHTKEEKENLTLGINEDTPIDCKLWLSQNDHYHLGKSENCGITEDDGRNNFISFHDSKKSFFCMCKKTCEDEVSVYVLKYE